MISGNSHS